MKADSRFSWEKLQVFRLAPESEMKGLILWQKEWHRFSRKLEWMKKIEVATDPSIIFPFYQNV